MIFKSKGVFLDLIISFRLQLQFAYAEVQLTNYKEQFDILLTIALAAFCRQWSFDYRTSGYRINPQRLFEGGLILFHQS